MPHRYWTTADMVGIGDRVDLTEGHQHIPGTVTGAATSDRERLLTVAVDDGRTLRLSVPVMSTICTLHI